MIYLVQSYYTDKQNHPRKCLKIGYAKNIEERMKAYKTYNPSIQLLKTREGEYDLESFLHRYFDKYKLPDFNEWFIYKKEIIDKFDILDPLDETITREEYLEYIRKEIITNIIPEIYKDLRSQIPDLLDELKQEFDNNYSTYSSLYTEFPEWECKEIIIKTFKFLRELEIDYFANYTFSDISNRFPEEIPRQRLKENVFRDEALFLYKLSDETVTIEEYERISKEKLLNSEQDLKNFDAVSQYSSGDTSRGIEILLRDLRTRINSLGYDTAYTGIDAKSGRFAINKLVMLSERRAFELRSNVYKSEVTIYDEFAKISPLISYELMKKKEEKISSLRNFYYSTSKSFHDNMKLICETLLDPNWVGYLYISDLYWLPLNFRNCLYLVGPERIRANGYIEAEVLKEIKLYTADDSLVTELKEKFIIGNRYSLKEAKEMIGDIYKKLGIKQNPKASDLEKYFNLREIKINDPILNKRIAGYEILSLKE